MESWQQEIINNVIAIGKFIIANNPMATKSDMSSIGGGPVDFVDYHFKTDMSNTGVVTFRIPNDELDPTFTDEMPSVTLLPWMMGKEILKDNGLL